MKTCADCEKELPTPLDEFGLLGQELCQHCFLERQWFDGLVDPVLANCEIDDLEEEISDFECEIRGHEEAIDELEDSISDCRKKIIDLRKSIKDTEESPLTPSRLGFMEKQKG